MKKKRIFLALVLAVVMLVSLAGAALAADPTTVDVTWDGAGIVDGTVTSGDDANAAFTSFGATGNVGVFNAVDNNDNPYTYNVDSCVFSLDTNISGGGYAGLQVNRTDAKTSYGLPGQLSYTYVEIANGSATLQNRSNTNYASMRDSNYGWNANNHITVTGASSYYLERYMDSGNTNFAGIQAGGAGDADLDCMSSEASAGQVRLGWGCGCYTNADFAASGSGTLTLTGVGNNSATTAALPGMTGANAFSIIASWLGSFNISDYSTTTN